MDLTLSVSKHSDRIHQRKDRSDSERDETSSPTASLSALGVQPESEVVERALERLPLLLQIQAAALLP